MDEVSIDAIIRRHLGKRGPLLPLLLDVQAAFGHVSPEAERTVAGALNLSRAEVHGVVSFYHDFDTVADPRPVLKLCRAEACQARGSEALAAASGDIPGIRVETIYCLGLCGVGPNAMLGEEVHTRLDAEKLAALVQALA
jgi:formate dehydrogenase subunit gamma